MKVSDAGPTVTASVLEVPSAPFACGVTVTAPDGSVSSTTVQVAVPPASATVTAVSETVTPRASRFTTDTDTPATATPS